MSQDSIGASHPTGCACGQCQKSVASPQTQAPVSFVEMQDMPSPPQDIPLPLSAQAANDDRWSISGSKAAPDPGLRIQHISLEDVAHLIERPLEPKISIGGGTMIAAPSSGGRGI